MPPVLPAAASAAMPPILPAAASEAMPPILPAAASEAMPPPTHSPSAASEATPRPHALYPAVQPRTSRRAASRRQCRTAPQAPANHLPSLAPHGVGRGCSHPRSAEYPWRSQVHRSAFRRQKSRSSHNPAMGGVEGEGPSSFLLGDPKGDILFREREYPPFSHAVPQALPLTPSDKPPVQTPV